MTARLSYTARVTAALANFEALKVWVAAREAEYRAGGEYTSHSVRSALRDMGVGESGADDVIALIGNHGFDYCMDVTWAHRDGSFPPAFACVWGVDQLRSRLDCVFIPRSVRQRIDEYIAGGAARA